MSSVTHICNHCKRRAGIRPVLDCNLDVTYWYCFQCIMTWVFAKTVPEEHTS